MWAPCNASVHTPPYNFVMLYICRNSKIFFGHTLFIGNVVCEINVKRGLFRSMGVRDVTCVNVLLMHLAGPREVCVCITYLREAWIEGPAGEGRGRDSTRNERGLERER